MRKFFLALLAFLSVSSFASVTADFSADKYSGCAPLLVNFTNESSPSSVTVSWNFGNGNSSVLQNPSAAFNNSGVYTVKLIVTDGVQTDSITKTITVFRTPQVDFHAAQVNVCGDDTLFLFNDVIPGDAPITDYAWGFGNGVASSDKDATYVFNATGQFSITLVVQDSNTCSANLTKPAYINVMPKPTASFTASPMTSCNISEVVTFTNTSTGTGLTYLWELDDSVTSTLTNPVHTYYQEVQNVKLTVTNSTGCKKSMTKSIKVTHVIADFDANKTEACTGETIRFTNQSNFETSAFWDFGDDSTANANSRLISHSYAAPGVYTVKMVNRFGACSDSITKVAYITVTPGVSVSFQTDTVVSADCDNNAAVNFTNTTVGGVLFHWRFGDGTTSTLENPTHSYESNGSFTITLTVTDTNGCTVSGTKTTTISSNLPVPRFRGDTLSCPGGPTRFHNSSSGAVSYLWDFGDGDTSTLSNPTHFYSNLGTYTVTLTAYNANGCDSSITKTSYVRIDTVHADFTVNKHFSPCPPFVTLFTSTVNSNRARFLWDFGDGTTDTAANPTHIFFHPGIYTVTLIASTTTGCADTIVYPDLIEVQGPTGTFAATPSSGCSPLTVNFNATVSSNTSDIWCDLGDGTLVSDSTAFSHTYTGVSTYNPKFILVDEVGCTVPYDLPAITTHDAPSLQLKDTSVCTGTSAVISLGADSYQWSPATYLNCSTCNTVEITPAVTTSYIITATNQQGCQTTDTITITAVNLPGLTAQQTFRVCANAPIEIFAGNADSYSWSPSTHLDDATAERPVCTPAVTTTYTLNASNSLGCSSSAQVVVEVIEKIEANLVAENTICQYGSVQINTELSAAPDSAISYFWTPSDFQIATDVANPLIDSLSQTTTFRVIVESGSCEADTAEITINVTGKPVIEVSPSVITSPNAAVQVAAASREVLTYSWVSNDDMSCQDCQRTNVYPSQTQYVYVTATNQYGCSITDSVLITVMKCDPKAIFAANTFTPNNDGTNDKFLVRSKVLDKLSYFRVFDQWGKMVYETSDLNEGWDGTINGQPAPVAVYAYLLSGTCDNEYSVYKSDNITLVR